MKPFVSVGRVAAAAAVLAVSAAATVWLAMEGYYPYLAVTVCAGAWAVVRLLRLYTRSVRKAAFMFDAIESDDYAFSFTREGRSAGDVHLNEALNRIKEILANAKRQVAEREKYYELIMDSVRTGILTVNDHGSVYQANAEALRIFRLPVLTHISQLAAVEPAIRDAIAGIGPGEKAQVSFSNEQGEVSVSLIASEVVLAGQMLKIVSVTDINNELAEKELEAWMRLTRVLTHEIMNSLSPITSLSDTLMGMGGSKDMMQGLRTINATSKSLVSFVESYRKFTFIPAPVRELFPVKPFLDRMVALQLREFGGEITCSATPEDVMVYADEDLVGQVVVNVLKNSVQAVAGKTDGRIWIDCRVDERENVVVEIGNNGDAIPARIAENIFMPFFTTKEDGSGVGLSISRQIMRLHNGSVRLSSNTDGKVAFTLIFS